MLISSFTEKNENIIEKPLIKVPLSPKIFFAEINFRYCPVYEGENVFVLGFFLQMLYLFYVRELGTFLPHG